MIERIISNKDNCLGIFCISTLSVSPGLNIVRLPFCSLLLPTLYPNRSLNPSDFRNFLADSGSKQDYPERIFVSKKKTVVFSADVN